MEKNKVRKKKAKRNRAGVWRRSAVFVLCSKTNMENKGPPRQDGQGRGTHSLPVAHTIASRK
jgi:hypothetical protein